MTNGKLIYGVDVVSDFNNLERHSGPVNCDILANGIALFFKRRSTTVVELHHFKACLRHVYISKYKHVKGMFIIISVIEGYTFLNEMGPGSLLIP